jgi:nucleotide-binding universal stress UspA family protein
MVEFDEILVPVDGSEGAMRAAQFGARLAKALNCPLKLAHVAPLTPESVMAMAKMDRKDIEAHERSRGARVVASTREAIADTGVDAQDLVLVGDAAEEILNYIAKHPKTLVVMGRRGLSRLEGLVVGSVSDKVSRHARGAVTLVN